jgi:HEAT repeat protein
VPHDFTRARGGPGRWAAFLTAAALAGTGLCGCANFWDDVTSRDFKIKSLWTARPDPMVVLRDSTDGDERARALRALQEPKQHGGGDEQQEVVVRILATAAVNEPQPWCRLAAIQTLGRFKDPRAVSALKAAYDQAAGTAPSDIQQAAYQPAHGVAPETAAALRCHALASLGQTQNPAAVDLLVRVVRQPPVEGTEQDRSEAMDERITAARALGKFNQPEATEALLKVLQTEKDVALRDRAADALQQITGKKIPADAKAWEEALHPGPNGPPPAPKREKFLGLF